MKSLRFLLPLAIFALLGGLLWSGLGKDPRLVPSPLIGKPAPAFDLPELRDATMRVSKVALLGQPYLLNVWGSWCFACTEEHPVLVELAGRKLLPIVGLNWKDEPADATRWLARFGDPYAHIAQDREGRTAIDFGVYGAPESFLVDARGVIRWKHVGPLTPAVIDQELLPKLAEVSR